MISNARKVLCAPLLMLCLSASSYADDRVETPTEGRHETICYSSDEILKLSETDEDTKIEVVGNYVFVTNYTSPKDYARSYFKKEKNKRMCLIAEFSADETSESYSEKGELVQIVASSWYPMTQGGKEIIYKADKTGHFFPSECLTTYNDGKKVPFNCRSGGPFPGFDCSNPKKLSYTEQTICNDSELSDYDSILAANYKALRAADIGELRDKLTRDQREWLKRRNECKDNKDCLLGAYRERINEICNNYPVVSGSQPSCNNPDEPTVIQ